MELDSVFCYNKGLKAFLEPKVLRYAYFNALRLGENQLVSTQTFDTFRLAKLK